MKTLWGLFLGMMVFSAQAGDFNTSDWYADKSRLFVSTDQATACAMAQDNWQVQAEFNTTPLGELHASCACEKTTAELAAARGYQTAAKGGEDTPYFSCAVVGKLNADWLEDLRQLSGSTGLVALKL